MGCSMDRARYPVGSPPPAVLPQCQPTPEPTVLTGPPRRILTRRDTSAPYARLPTLGSTALTGKYRRPSTSSAWPRLSADPADPGSDRRRASRSSTRTRPSALSLHRAGQQATHEELSQRQVDDDRRRGCDERAGHLDLPLSRVGAGQVLDGDVDRRQPWVTQDD